MSWLKNSELQRILVDILIILTIGLISVTWFKDGYLIAKGDLLFPLADPTIIFRAWFYTWRDTFSLGIPGYRMLPVIPFMTSISLLYKIGFSLEFIEKMLFYFWFTLSGISMYYLSYSTLNHRNTRLIAISSALFYMMNPYSMIIRWYDLTLVNFLYTLLPLLLAFYIKGLQNKSKFYLFVFAVVFFLALPFCSNPAYIIILSGILFIYLTFHVLLNFNNKLEIFRSIKFTTKLILLLLGLNMWWFLPLISFIPVELEKASLEHVGFSFVETVKLSSSDSTFLNIFRLQGQWNFDQIYQGTSDPWYPYSSIYFSKTFILISFLIPIIVFLSLLNRNISKNGRILYFGTLSVLGLFLLKGINPPLDNLIEYLYSNFSIFGAFRNHYEKFGFLVALGYAYLFGVGVAKIYEWLENKPYGKAASVSSISLIFFLVFGVYMWPFWTGEVIYSGGEVIPSAHIKVPEYYQAAKEWLRTQDTDFRIFPLPLSKIHWTSYHWYYGYDSMEWLLPKPVASRNTGRNVGISVFAAKSLIDNRSGAAGLLRDMNVKYILLHGDANWDFIKNNNAQRSQHVFLQYKELEERLTSNPEIQLAKEIGELKFYKNKYWKPRAVYASTKFIQVKGNLSDLLNSYKENKSEDYVRVLIEGQEPKFVSYFYEVGDRVDILQYKKINPSKYKLLINSTGPYFLVLSQAYDPGWKAYEGDVNWITTLLKEPIGYHFKANGYSNGWKINSRGNQQITLYFYPQNFVYAGIFVTFLALLILLRISQKTITRNNEK